MGFIEELTILPAPGHLRLLSYVLIGTFLLHVPYMGLMLGCSLVSMLFNAAGRLRGNPTCVRFARDMIEAMARYKSVGLIFGLVPQIVLVLTFAQVLFERNIFRIDIHMYVPAFVLLGLLFIYAYRWALTSGALRFEPTMLLGLAGASFIMLGFLLFHGGIGIIVNPDGWAFDRAPPEFIVASSVTPDYLRFLVLSLGLAGGWILFLKFGPPETRAADEEDYLAFCRVAGMVMVGAYVAVQPLLTLWYGLAQQVSAVSPATLTLSAITLVVLFLTAFVMYSHRGRLESRLGLYVLPLLVAAYFAGAVDAHVLRQNATKEERSIVLAEGREARDELMARLEGDLGEATSPERGRRVFEDRCSSCHRFDTKLVGPPLAEVLPKYVEAPEELKAFIENPVKIDPDYPPMPRLGLRSTEIEAVAAYLLQRIGGEGGTEGP